MSIVHPDNGAYEPQPPAARADGPAPLESIWPDDNPMTIKAREATSFLRDFARVHGMSYYTRDPLVVAIHNALDALTAALAEVATLKAENQRLKAEIQTETCPSCGEVCPAGWCGVCHVPIMTDWEKGFQRICEVAAQNLARAEQAEAEVATLHQAHQQLKAEHHRLRSALLSAHTYTRDPDKPGELMLAADIRAALDETHR